MARNILFLPVLSILALSALAGCGESERTQQRSFEDPVDRIVIDAESGTIDIAATDSSVTHLEAVSMWRSSREPTLTARYDAGTLYVSGECPRSVTRCEMDLMLAVPRDVDVELATHDGAVTIDGIHGDIEVRLDSGDVEVTHVTSDFVAAEVDNGRITLELEEAVQDVDVRTDNGDIRVVLPPGAYDVDAATHRGAVDVDVDTLQGADASIFARAENGSISIARF